MGDVTHRNIWWSMEFTRLCIASEELRNAVPEDATVIILPEDDQELCRFNLELASHSRSAEVLVCVTIPASREPVDLQRVRTEPSQQFALA